MKSFHSMIPDADTVLALEPEELAGFLLEYLHSLDLNERWSLNPHNMFHDPSGRFSEYPNDRRVQVRDAVVEAWMHLEREGLLVPRIEESGRNTWVFSRRGSAITTRARWKEQRGRQALPREQLHARIREDVWHLFVRGKFDTAVFEAFKEVEVAVRAAAALKNTDIGVDLMRKAFDKSKGPLRDETVTDGERDSLAHLFAGAIGLFKNPQSHRRVALTDPHEAAEMILFANYLLRIVDDTQQARRI
jgi:uncharacterized protein (TIGR02391 family)